MEQVLSAIEKAIDEALPGSGKPFAVFDFDNTCIINDMGDAIFAYLSGHELLRDRGLLGEIDTSPTYHERVYHINFAILEAGKSKASYVLNARLFSRFTPGEAEAIALAAITEEGVRLGSKMLYGHHIERGLALRRNVLTIMNYLRARGVEIWISSATAEPAIRAAMRHFGIEGNLVASRSVMQDGVYTSELVEPLSMFEGKLDCIKKFIDAEQAPLLVAGDSPNDLPMLEAGVLKVVVNRDNELAKIARERGWFLI